MTTLANRGGMKPKTPRTGRPPEAILASLERNRQLMLDLIQKTEGKTGPYWDGYRAWLKSRADQFERDMATVRVQGFY